MSNFNESVQSITSLEYKKDLQEEIVYSHELKFSYTDGDKLIKLLALSDVVHDNLFLIDVLKYNVGEIIEQLVKYFPEISIRYYSDSPCASECKIKDKKFCYLYGIYLVLNTEREYFEYGYDFTSNLDEITDAKYNDSKVLLDNYEYFSSQDIKSNDDIRMYLSDILFKLLTVICSLKSDEYKLAEIMFVKSNQNKKTDKEILREMNYFTRIINWKKTDSINLMDLYDNLQLKDDVTEEFIEYKKFSQNISLICDKFNIRFDKKQSDINFDIFQKILLNLNTKYNSDLLVYYKDIFQQTMCMLMESLRLIIQMIKEINIKKKFTSDYINNFIKFHINEYYEPKIFDNIYIMKINEKKYLFDNLQNQINNYSNKNKHSVNKLDEIKFNFDTLCDNIYDV